MSTALIRTEALARSFPMGGEEVQALRGASLSLAQGSFVAVIGPSGSGKSTLLYLLGGLDRPTSGAVEVDGQRLEELDENQLATYRRQKVGFVFQSFNLIQSMTALENVIFPMVFGGIRPAERLQRGRALLEQVGLADRAGHRPGELSGGQQQRVAVARALVNSPELVLADEPTGNLDTHSGGQIMHLLAELHQQGRTVVVVSHDARVTQYATDTVRLLDGLIVDEQTYAQALGEARGMPS